MKIAPMMGVMRRMMRTASIGNKIITEFILDFGREWRNATHIIINLINFIINHIESFLIRLAIGIRRRCRRRRGVTTSTTRLIRLLMVGGRRFGL